MPHDWRDSLRLAMDLALLGIVVTLAALPVVTAGAAVGAGSAAIHRLITTGRWPTAAECWASFRERLVPGLPAGPLVLVAVALVVADVAALRRGAVPGGGPVTAVVLLAAAAGAGFAGLAAGFAGLSATGAVRMARRAVADRPHALAAATGTILVAAVLAVFVHPALVPVLVGYVLFAMQAQLFARKASAVAANSGESTTL